MGRDNIYADRDSGDAPFRFNEAVAQVFPDMLQRSIPGYAASLEAIGSLAARYVQPQTNCSVRQSMYGATSRAIVSG